MKTKLSTLFITLFAFVWLNAQQIVTFETGDTPLATITGADASQQTDFDQNADNPEKTGLNTSDKCLYILTNQVLDEDPSIARPGWGENVFYIDFDEPVNVTDANRYLHILHLKERILNMWLVYADPTGDGTFLEIGRGTCVEANKWFDMVVDIKSKMNTVKRIRVHLDGNWGSDVIARSYEPTKFYYDDIVLNEQNLPRGSAPSVQDPNLIDFENESPGSFVSLNVQNEAYITDLHYANIDINSPNNTEYCAYFKGGTTKPLWWHGFHFIFSSPIDATDYTYLHAMLKKGTSEPSRVQFSVVNTNGTQSANGAMYNDPITTEWVDYVVEIPATHKIFKELYIKYNAQSPDTECFADEIILSNDPTPRTSIITGIRETQKDYSVQIINGIISIKNNAVSNISIYNINGLLLKKVVASALDYAPLVNGLYFVQIDGISEKVLVK